MTLTSFRINTYEKIGGGLLPFFNRADKAKLGLPSAVHSVRAGQPGQDEVPLEVADSEELTLRLR